MIIPYDISRRLAWGRWANRTLGTKLIALEADVQKHGYGENHTKEWLTNDKTKVQLGIL